MKVTKTVCDKCGKEINGRFYILNVSDTYDWHFGDLYQMPKYQSYEICHDCLKDVITDDVIGSPFMASCVAPPSVSYCV